MVHTPSGFWRPWKRHWLFVAALFLLGPTCGYALAQDRGLLFGVAVSVFASGWLLWSQRERKAAP